MKIKQSMLLMLASGMALSLASCASDEPVVNDAPNGLTRFVVTLPDGFTTRAFGDGSTAENLTYAVYETGSKTPLIVSCDEVKFVGRRAEVQLALAKEGTYDIIFWADHEDAPYELDAENQQINISYSDAVGNAEERDAFFGVEKGVSANGTSDHSIVLKRPFAQINLGTNDYEGTVASKFPRPHTTMTVKTQMPTALNLYDGTVSGADNVAFSLAVAPDGEVYPIDGHKYLSMDYILVGEDKSLMDCTFEFYNDENTKSHSLDISNVPVKRNWRTNLYGSLLSNAHSYIITIDPIFDDSHDIKVWDGETKTTVLPVKKMIDGVEHTVLEVSDGAEYAYVLDKINAREDDYNKYDVEFTDDLDLGGHTISSLGLSPLDAGGKYAGEGEYFGTNTDVDGRVFYGNVYGNGHTVKNVRITGLNAVAFIQQLRGENTEVSDLHLENVTIDVLSHWSAPKWCGVLVAYVNGTGTTVIKNCSVKDSKIVAQGDLFAAGGLVGYVSTSNLTVNNCSVENVTIKGTGGTNEVCQSPLVGKLYQSGNLTVQFCTVKNVTTHYGCSKDELAIGDGCGNGFVLGNIFAYGAGAGLNVTMSNCTGLSEWHDVSTQGVDIAAEAPALNPLYPNIGGWDTYAGNNSATVTIDGTRVFPF